MVAIESKDDLYVIDLLEDFDEFYLELEKFAEENRVPIIDKIGIRFLIQMLKVKKAKNLLEIGTAIGFSALLMAEHAPQAQITTIDRNPEMIELAKANFAKYDSRQQITLLEGDAVDLLETLEDSYNLVFMDSAKSKYVVFLPQVLKRLNPGGLVLIDDVFQGGDVAKPFEDIKRGQRAIYRGLHSLFDATLDSPDLTASLLPLGDGLLMIRKK